MNDGRLGADTKVIIQWCHRWTACVSIVLLLVGCSRNSGNNASDTRKATTTTTKAMPSPPVSDTKAMRFATELEAAVKHGDAEAFNALIDVDAMLDQMLDGLQIDNDKTQEFRIGFREGVRKGGVAKAVINATRDGGHFKLLHVRKHVKQTRALFRMVGNDSALNYYDFLLSKHRDNKVLAVDVYIFAAGERISETARRVAILTLARESADLLDRLISSEGESVRHLAKVFEMSEAVQKGDHQHALRVWDTMPESLKRNKTVVLVKLQAAAKSSDDLYLQTLDDIRSQFKDEPWLALLSIDAFVLREQYDSALLEVQKLNEAVGGDPYLDVCRANILHMKRDFMAARVAVENAIRRDPDLEDAYWTAITISLETKDFRRTSELLRRVRQKFEVDLSDLASNEGYAEYVKSPEYRQLVESSGASDSSADLD